MKKMGFTGFVLLTLSIIIFGCGNSSVRTPEEMKVPEETPVQEETVPAESEISAETEMIEMTETVYKMSEEPVREIETAPFDLGKETYQAPSGRDMPFSVRGIISAPKQGENLPLVVMLHGSHDNENPDARIYEGFEYLTKKVAERGFVAVSLDVQSAFTWSYGDSCDGEKSEYILDTFLEYLQKCLNSELSFPLELAGKVDINRLILVGHSRGGDNILDYAGRNESVIGLLCIAPPGNRQEDTWRDIPLAMVVSELDGDVCSYSSYWYWPEIQENHFESPSIITFVEGANHNNYNEKLTRDDAEILYAEEDLAKRITAEKQREFLSAYVSDFCDYCVGKERQNTIFDLTKPALNEMVGVKIRSLYGGKQFEECLDVTQKQEGGTLEVTNAIDIDSIHEDTMSAFESGMSKADVLHIGWGAEQGSLSVLEQGAEPVGRQGFAVSFAVNPGDERNMPGAPQSFSIDVIMKSGKTFEIVLPDTLTQLACMTGKLYEDNYDGLEVKTWSRVTPPSTVLIPFEYYGINTEEVSDIRLNFDKTETGSIVLFSAELF